MSSARYALIDGHVHFHACFDPDEFLNCAWANFARAAVAAGFGDRFSAYLLMTETAHAHWFDDLSQRAGSSVPIAEGWTVRATAHPCQVKLVGPEGAELNVISGYQIVTTENLEVLALGSIERIPDGEPADRVIEAARASGAIPVVPWGFGKWLGRRGKCVHSLVDSSAPGELFLGDNSNRLAGFPEPPILRRARAAGFQILPGTDPLPFAREAARAGTLGFLLECNSAFEDADSWSTVRDKIERREAVTPFGDFENPWSFARNQIAMQLYKRSGTGSAAA
ncbi:MAG TPA: hypothetical protein VGC50_07410 [Gammaproteobacteria bacterium]|jgi:hypothetical protein